jgi:hypothetical protein
MKRIVLTVATSDAWYSRWFDISCKKVGGYTPVTLGAGVKWEGFMTGIKLVRDYLREVEDPENTLIFLNDKYDIVFVNPLDPLFDRFEAALAECRTPHLLKISTEDTNVYRRFCWGDFNGKSINSGSMLATAATMRHIFESISEYKGALADDQKLIVEFLQKNRDDFTVDLDDNADFIVFSIMNAVTGANIRCDKATGTARFRKGAKYIRPALIHRPANMDMDILLEELGYEDVHVHKGKGSVFSKVVYQGQLVMDKILGMFS